MATLHPFSVHLPIVLVLLWPVIDAIGFYYKKPDVSHVGLGLLFGALAASLFSTLSGQAAYDIAIARGHDPDILDVHASVANYVPWLLLIVVAIRTYGVKRFGQRGHILALVAGVLLMTIIVRVGLSGGELVFVHRVGISEPAPSAIWVTPPARLALAGGVVAFGLVAALWRMIMRR